MKRRGSPRYSQRFDYEGDEAEASSPPSSPKKREDGFQYDVFLSFRGTDTRKGFTGHLHYALKEKGIVTFMDSDDLEKGEKVEKLFGYIQRSKIFISIFSKGYANSKWCLREIVKIVECKRLIVPIFFDVEPRDVVHQTGPFADAFTNYIENEKVDKEEVSNWRAALSEAGQVSGHNLADTDGNEANLIRLIVKMILPQVNKTPIFVAEHPVGLRDRVTNMMRILDLEAQRDAKMVGIYGMGGIGKTTLANAVYNEISNRFDACSFIANVREVATPITGLVSLQEQLLRDVLKVDVKVNGINQGIGIIKQRIGSKKVLLVLDDVDNQEQVNALVGCIDWFHLGSRIIITTRDKHVLSEPWVKQNEAYALETLDDTQSHQLFSWHAFKGEKPNEDFAELSKEVASTADGLPLALIIFGSHFRNLKTVEDWIDELERLKEDQDQDIHKKLKISYDALHEIEKKAFLDIACFFIPKHKDIEFAILMWEACKFHPKRAIDVLIQRCLVSRDDETGQFEMHDHIRDMGRKIVQDESPSNPGRRSRLWKDDEILAILENKRGNEKVEAIQLGAFGNSISVKAESLATMPKLRMLHIGGNVTLEGQYKRFPKKLRWLKWQIKRDLESLPAVLGLENLVVLDLRESDITQVWNLGPNVRGMAFEKLKVLRLAHCSNLTSCPDFSTVRMPHLLELNLEYCWMVSELHPTVGLLKSLTRLNLMCCSSLKKLPEEIYELTSLEELDLRYCGALTTFPSPSRDSESLKQHLLGKLRVLKLLGCRNLTNCPDFARMPHLPQLCFTYCEKLSKLDRSIGQLKSLIHLDLEGCKSLKELPQEVGQLTSLKEINLHGCSQISTLPESMGRLKQLQRLDLFCCSLLQEVPEWILSLDQLEILRIDGCPLLEFLPQLPPSLTELHASSFERLVDIPGIEQLKRLKRLQLGWCRNLHCGSFFERVQDLDSLTELDLGRTAIEELPALSALEKLEKLSVEYCERLKSLPKFPPSLYHLDAEGCKELTMIQDVSSAKKLRHLDLGVCKKLVDIPGIEQLKGLEFLQVRACKSLHDSFFERLQNLISNKQGSLREVGLSGTAIEELPALGNLEILRAWYCVRLKFLGKLPPSLIKLSAMGCKELTRIEDFSSAKRLRKVDLSECIKLEDLPGIEQLRQSIHLKLCNCRSLPVSFRKEFRA